MSQCTTETSISGVSPFRARKIRVRCAPGAGQGYIEMITPGLGSVAADPRRAGRTVSGHPVAENTVRTHETSAAGGGIVPLIVPLIVPTTVNEQSHFILLKSSASIGLTYMPCGRAPPQAYASPRRGD